MCGECMVDYPLEDVSTLGFFNCLNVLISAGWWFHFIMSLINKLRYK